MRTYIAVQGALAILAYAAGAQGALLALCLLALANCWALERAAAALRRRLALALGRASE